MREDLPLPIVHYPNLYGTFLAYSESENSTVYLCSCAESGVQNFIRLQQMALRASNANQLPEAPLDSFYFPGVVAQASKKHRRNPLRAIRFRSSLCHRCNLAIPALRYCHEMYGGRFKQTYGWYINQTCFRLGIHPFSFEFLSDVCPHEYHEQVLEVKNAQAEYLREEELRRARAFGLQREDIGSSSNEVLYPSTTQLAKAERTDEAWKKATRLVRSLSNVVENLTRQEFGVRKVGKAWVSETILYNIVCRLFPQTKTLRHHRPQWLRGLELDIYLPELNMAIEYQGQQHFYPVDAWGGPRGLKMVKSRDRLKSRLCQSQGIRLIKIKFTEPLTEDSVRNLLRKGSFKFAGGAKFGLHVKVP